MQRCAIARAVVHLPSLLIADEPTGNLDSNSGSVGLELFAELNQTMGVTILLATHAAEVAAAARRVVRMRDGRIESRTRCSLEALLGGSFFGACCTSRARVR